MTFSLSVEALQALVLPLARPRPARALGWLKPPDAWGAGTMRNVLTYCGLYTLGEQPRQAVAGVADEVMAKLRRWGAVTPPTRHRGVFVIFDPEAAKRALDEVCAAAGVDILLHAFVFGADREDNAVARLRFADHSGEHQLEAKG